MASEAQIKQIMTQMEAFHAMDIFRHFNAVCAGIGAVLRLLNMAEEGSVTAGRISNELCVSTARVAALLRKMEEKDLIERCPDPHDRRVTVVLLTAHGRDMSKKMCEDVRKNTALLIDRIGMERLTGFMETGKEICGIFTELQSEARGLDP